MAQFDSDRHCGGKTRAGGKCTRPKGWGTDHAGRGKCKLHGGSTPTHRRAAQQEAAAEAVATYGLPREVDPLQALLEEVYRTAGHVAWLERVIRGLDADTLVEGVTRTSRTTELGSDDEDAPDEAANGPANATERVEHAAAVSVWVRLYQSERAHLTKVAKAAVDAGIEERLVHLAEEQAQLVAEFGRALLREFDVDPSSEKARRAFRKHLTVVSGGKAS